MKYYLRVPGHVPLHFKDGSRVPVEHNGSGYGVIALEDSEKCKELDGLADKHLGMEHLTAAKYEEYKKKPARNIGAPNPLREIRLADPKMVDPFVRSAVAEERSHVKVVVDPPPSASPAPAPDTAEPAKPMRPRKAKPKQIQDASE